MDQLPWPQRISASASPALLDRIRSFIIGKRAEAAVQSHGDAWQVKPAAESARVYAGARDLNGTLAPLLGRKR